MITVVADTHGETAHRLQGRTLEAVRAADFVVHAGDLVTEAVLDAFVAEAGRFAGVVGNNDTAAVRERLPSERVVESDGVRLAVVHGHEHTEQALSLLGRQAAADLVVVGHSHRPGIHEAGDVALVNPGSHAQPRGYRAAHAELTRDGDSVVVSLVTPEGEVFEERQVAVSTAR